MVQMRRFIPALFLVAAVVACTNPPTCPVDGKSCQAGTCSCPSGQECSANECIPEGGSIAGSNGGSFGGSSGGNSSSSEKPCGWLNNVCGGSCPSNSVCKSSELSCTCRTESSSSSSSSQSSQKNCGDDLTKPGLQCGGQCPPKKVCGIDGSICKCEDPALPDCDNAGFGVGCDRCFCTLHKVCKTKLGGVFCGERGQGEECDNHDQCMGSFCINGYCEKCGWGLQSCNNFCLNVDGKNTCVDCTQDTDCGEGRACNQQMECYTPS